jgi:hypothetical protein
MQPMENHHHTLDDFLLLTKLGVLEKVINLVSTYA